MLLADGSSRRIDEVAEGDQVVAQDPETGRSRVEPVTDLHVNQDVELTDLAVRTEDGEFVTLETTQNHPFWSDSRQEWVDASELRPTEVLRTATGEVVSIAKVRNFVGVATMHDLTVANLHTYYVLAEDVPLLVHNCGDDDDLVTMFHYTHKKGYNGIRAGNPYHIKSGDSKNGAGPFFTNMSPADIKLAGRGAFKSQLGLTSEKTVYVMEFLVPKSSLTRLRGGRGQHVFEIRGGIQVPRSRVRFSGFTSKWE
ncbi:polymorphic toxin-type HINT domain-containing protein [Micromonospora cathayae]|uniref:Polymorphic toxin-type HINT domain-containing protein n=1 Tax=Micromonospora cathayae TaxID=3028804 RepID=A0ABY7ZM99_9ACTN|nr:polymorphic toxin-type HINT domain-containing protein [Micromonospora sp. HUAS 3]WDZ84085.1 polymorphic toxin-type HINT domain-containing protein [Micromonospora sp. HUAS 3]